MNVLSVFNALTPDESKPGAIPLWRQRVAGWLTLLTVAVFVILPFALPLWTDMRYISKASADETHQQMERDIADIKGAIDTLVSSDEARALRERQREIREVRAAIVQTRRDACAAEGEARAVLSAQEAELRSDYMALTNEEFPPLACEDLGV